MMYPPHAPFSPSLYADGMTKATAPPGAAKRKYTLKQRLAAVKAFYGAGSNLKKAVVLLAAQWIAQWGPKPAAKGEFIQRWVRRLEKDYDLHDAPRSGRPPTLTDVKAKWAAKEFKRGYLPTPTPTKKKGAKPRKPDREYYLTIQEACTHNEQLRALCADYNITPDALLQRMRKVDKSLKRQLRDTKDPLSNKEMAARQKAAERFLERWLNTRTGGDAFLDRLGFLDKATIYVSAAAARSLYAWMEANNPDASCVVPVPWDS